MRDASGCAQPAQKYAVKAAHEHSFVFYLSHVYPIGLKEKKYNKLSTTEHFFLKFKRFSFSMCCLVEHELFFYVIRFSFFLIFSLLKSIMFFVFFLI